MGRGGTEPPVLVLLLLLLLMMMLLVVRWVWYCCMVTAVHVRRCWRRHDRAGVEGRWITVERVDERVQLRVVCGHWQYGTRHGIGQGVVMGKHSGKAM